MMPIGIPPHPYEFDPGHGRHQIMAFARIPMMDVMPLVQFNRVSRTDATV